MPADGLCDKLFPGGRGLWGCFRALCLLPKELKKKKGGGLHRFAKKSKFIRSEAVVQIREAHCPDQQQTTSVRRLKGLKPCLGSLSYRV